MVEFIEDWYDNLLNNSDEKEVLIRKILDLQNNSFKDAFLEIGMGTSACFSEKLRPFFKEYWIVDNRPCNASLPENVKYIHEDFENVKLQRTFDVILLSHVIYYFKNLDFVIEKTINLLKKDGSAYFVVNGKDADYGLVKNAFSEFIDIPYSFTYDRLKEALYKHQKEYQITEHSVPSHVFFKSHAELYELLKLFFDVFPEEFQKNKERIISWLKKNIKGNKFKMNQKIFELRKGK
jgi:SAM-dependent methyltransferase